MCGLPVLGSTRSVQVRVLAKPDHGWVFDPLKSGSMDAALEVALRESTARLNDMRSATRRSIASLHCFGHVQPADSAKEGNVHGSVQQRGLAQA